MKDKFKNLSKFELLGLLNFIIALWPLMIILRVINYSSIEPNLNTVTNILGPNIIFLFSMGLSIYLGVKLFWYKAYDKKYFRQCLVLTILPILWTIGLFISYFLVNQSIYPIISLVLIIGIFIFFKKFSSKVAILVTGITILVITFAILGGFEESYCWNKGDEMALGKPEFIDVPAGEAKRVFGTSFEVSTTGTSKVSSAWYYHMDCHQNFDFTKALQEKYLFNLR